MDLQKMTDIEKLQALAYRQIVLQQQALHNLQLIEARIAELQQFAQQEPVNASKSRPVLRRQPEPAVS